MVVYRPRQKRTWTASDAASSPRKIYLNLSKVTHFVHFSDVVCFFGYSFLFFRIVKMYFYCRKKLKYYIQFFSFLTTEI